LTAHQVRLKRPAKGMPMGHLVRIIASLDPADFELVQAIAAERKVPLALVIREAVLAYVQKARAA
jgi:hypothetical protein